MGTFLDSERVGILDMIPKRIHYCWFGKKEKPHLAKRCIESWKKYCPNYEIIEWNEENFDIQAYPYAMYCYKHQKYAFLSDFVRLMVVYQFGGIYLDTDVELLKSLDELLVYEAFYGFENRNFINTGLGFGAVKENFIVREMLQEYLNLQMDSNGNFPIQSCPSVNTKTLISLGLVTDGSRQNICGAEVFTVDYLNPYDDQTGCLKQTNNTISIHWYSKSWMKKSIILKSRITKPFHRIFGVNCFEWVKERGTKDV